jgi:transposase, IS5 family
MVGRLHRNASLFYVAFDREASLIKDDLLEQVDSLLDDRELLDLVTEALGSRAPLSAKTGRNGIAPDRLLRCCVLKQLKQWSFRGLERELRASLVYRRFTRFDQDRIPDFTSLSRSMACLGPEVTKKIHDRIVKLAVQQDVVQGRRLRTDTTVVESNIHYPADSTLLADGIRVVTRVVKSIAGQCEQGALKVVDHAKSVKLRVIEIHRAAKSKLESAKNRLVEGYGKLTSLATAVLNKGKMVADMIDLGVLPVVGDLETVFAKQAELQHFLPLVEQVIAQSKARVFEGDTHFPSKLVSIFEEHSQVIRKGKAGKSTEFGRLVRLDEVENGVVSNYEVNAGVPADQASWMPALSQHKEIFGQAPRVATADRGFFSALNERQAQEAGVRKVALPARGRLSGSRARLQSQRWFKQAQRWRAGIESRIATLKHCFAMTRARFKGDSGFQRFVGWSVITNNLVSIARAKHKDNCHGSQTQRAA